MNDPVRDDLPTGYVLLDRNDPAQDERVKPPLLRG